MKNKGYYVTGRVTLEVEFELEASSQEEAEKIAVQDLIDVYNLKTLGMPHFPETVIIDIDVEEIEYED